MADYKLNNTIATQINGQGKDMVNIREKFMENVEVIMPRYLNLRNFFNFENMQGTPTIWSDSISDGETHVFDRDEVPETDNYHFGKVALTLKLLSYTRGRRSLQDKVIDKYDVMPKIAQRQAKAMAELIEEVIAIQLCKAGMATTNPFGTKGFQPAVQQQVGSTAGAWEDPALLLQAIGKARTRLLTDNNVDAWRDGLTLAVRPEVFNKLYESEMITDMTNIVSAGNKPTAQYRLSNLGLNIIQTQSLPQTVISNYKLNDEFNNYDGDFTKVLGTFFTPDSLLCGEILPVTPDFWYDDNRKADVADLMWGGGARPFRVDQTGVLLDI